MTVRDAMRWFQAHLGFINRLPSWLNELLSGFLCVAIAYGGLSLTGMLLHTEHRGVLTFPVAFLLSEFYEHTMDPWGYNPQDVVERSRGIVLVMLAVTIRGML